MVRSGRRFFFFAGAMICIVLMQGCSAAAPRFGGEGTAREREGSTATGPERSAPPARRYEVDAPPGMQRDRLLLDVVSYLGAPYVHGGRAKTGMDCSAFTMQVYASALHIALPRSTRDQFKQGRKVSLDELAFGDLVFFNTTGERPSHVGIYIEDGLFAHASSSEGVTFSSLESSYYKQRFVGARRIVR